MSIQSGMVEKSGNLAGLQTVPSYWETYQNGIYSVYDYTSGKYYDVNSSQGQAIVKIRTNPGYVGFNSPFNNWDAIAKNSGMSLNANGVWVGNAKQITGFKTVPGPTGPSGTLVVTTGSSIDTPQTIVNMPLPHDRQSDPVRPKPINIDAPIGDPVAYPIDTFKPISIGQSIDEVKKVKIIADPIPIFDAPYGSAANPIVQNRTSGININSGSGGGEIVPQYMFPPAQHQYDPVNTNLKNMDTGTGTVVSPLAVSGGLGFDKKYIYYGLGLLFFLLIKK